MKSDILFFIRRAIKKYSKENIQACWFPGINGGTYFLHINGKAIQTFNQNDFYQLPQRYRMFMIEPLIKAGMANNLGTKNKDSIIGAYRLGKEIK